MRVFTYTWGAALILATLSAGCASTSMLIGEQKIVEGQDKPNWTETVPERNDQFTFWVGRTTTADSEEGALKDARKDVSTQVANFFGENVVEDYAKMRKQKAGNQELGRIRPYIKDVTLAVSKRLVAGLKAKTIHIQKSMTRAAESRVVYHYNAYVLMTLDLKYVKQVLDDVFSKQIQQAREKADQEAEGELKDARKAYDKFLTE